MSPRSWRSNWGYIRGRGLQPLARPTACQSAFRQRQATKWRHLCHEPTAAAGKPVPEGTSIGVLEGAHIDGREIAPPVVCARSESQVLDLRVVPRRKRVLPGNSLRLRWTPPYQTRIEAHSASILCCPNIVSIRSCRPYSGRFMSQDLGLPRRARNREIAGSSPISAARALADQPRSFGFVTLRILNA
jgi:hypothetical protein